MSDQVLDNARAAKRDSLYLSADIVVPGVRDTVSVRVRNLSEGGMMVDAHPCFVEHTPIIVELRGIGSVPGRIAWLMAGRTGIAFDTIIDPQKARTPIVRALPGSYRKIPSARAGRPALKPR